ncbi:MAG TPA: class I SAM-dependent methyltransferase [Thermoanaerobaculia bacterium]|nr:class I SAM-dependent methyltransferase [Thermoanaerobaculia bacterium]
MYRLFHEFAHRYDLHTPPGHYQHDHAFVISEALRVAPSTCRLLDIGCGTGVFLEAAIAAGIDGYGVDASPEMIDVARQRVGGHRVRVQRMQEISDEDSYDVVCSLSWTIHYCEAQSELDDVAGHCHRALRAGGHLFLQVASDQHMTGVVNVDREAGAAGEPDDTLFIHRFRPLHDAEHRVIADYVYASRAHRELLSEQHELRFANPSIIVGALYRAGFQGLSVTNTTSLSPFVIGARS